MYLCVCLLLSSLGLFTFVIYLCTLNKSDYMRFFSPKRSNHLKFHKHQYNSISRDDIDHFADLKGLQAVQMRRHDAANVTGLKSE